MKLSDSKWKQMLAAPNNGLLLCKYGRHPPPPRQKKEADTKVWIKIWVILFKTTYSTSKGQTGTLKIRAPSGLLHWCITGESPCLWLKLPCSSSHTAASANGSCPRYSAPPPSHTTQRKDNFMQSPKGSLQSFLWAAKPKVWSQDT